MIVKTASKKSGEQAKMGRVVAQLALANNEDVILAAAGIIPPDRIRRATVEGVVDSGATRLVLPQAVVKQLGLKSSAEVPVRYADHRKSKRKLVSNVHLNLQGRESVFSAVVEPRRTIVLIGAIVLEELDFIVDCTRQQLRPRDPEGILSEIE
jgi:predicted aspartyl protease